MALYACAEPAAPKEEVQNTQQDQNVTLVQQYFKHFNAHEWTAMAEMYAPTADFKDPSFGTEITPQTREETIAKYTALLEIFADLHDEVVQIYPAGEQHVVVEFISSGTAPDSSRFELPICTIFTFEEGKIIKDFTYYDNFEEPE